MAKITAKAIAYMYSSMQQKVITQKLKKSSTKIVFKKRKEIMCAIHMKFILENIFKLYAI